MLPADERHRDGSEGGVVIAEVDRTMTNGVRLEGHVMVPNLGYKKDTFLEPSLISNFLTDTPITNTFTTMSPTRCTTSKLVVNPIRVLLRHCRPMDPPLGPTASLGKSLNYSKSIGRLEERCYPDLTSNR